MTDHDRHVGSVRRAFRQLNELAEREYSHVNLRSSYIAELVHDAIEEARETTQRAVEAGTEALEAAERGRVSR